MSEAVLIDVRGLKCPLPVLKTARRMAPYPAGTRFHVLTNDPMMGVFRHADAGYPLAQRCADRLGVRVPMASWKKAAKAWVPS